MKNKIIYIFTLILITQSCSHNGSTANKRPKKIVYTHEQNTRYIPNYKNNIMSFPQITTDKDRQWVKENFLYSYQDSYQRGHNENKYLTYLNLFKIIEYRIRHGEFIDNELEIDFDTVFPTKCYGQPCQAEHFAYSPYDVISLLEKLYFIHDRVNSKTGKTFYFTIGDGTIYLSLRHSWDDATDDLKKFKGSLTIGVINSNIKLSIDSLLARDTYNKKYEKEIESWTKELTSFYHKTNCYHNLATAKAIPDQRACSFTNFKSPYTGGRAGSATAKAKQRRSSTSSLSSGYFAGFSKGFISGMNEINQMKRQHLEQNRKNWNMVIAHNNTVRAKEQQDAKRVAEHNQKIRDYKAAAKVYNTRPQAVPSFNNKSEVGTTENLAEQERVYTNEEIEKKEDEWFDKNKALYRRDPKLETSPQYTDGKGNDKFPNQHIGKLEDTKKVEIPERAYAACYSTPSGKYWLCDGPFQKLYAPEKDLNRALELVGCNNNMLEAKHDGAEELSEKSIHVYNCNKSLNEKDRVVRKKREYNMVQ